MRKVYTPACHVLTDLDYVLVYAGYTHHDLVELLGNSNRCDVFYSFNFGCSSAHLRSSVPKFIRCRGAMNVEHRVKGGGVVVRLNLVLYSFNFGCGSAHLRSSVPKFIQSRGAINVEHRVKADGVVVRLSHVLYSFNFGCGSAHLRSSVPKFIRSRGVINPLHRVTEVGFVVRLSHVMQGIGGVGIIGIGRSWNGGEVERCKSPGRSVALIHSKHGYHSILSDR